MLFFIWLGAAFIIVGSINLYLRYYGLPRPHHQISGSSTYPGTTSGVSSGSGVGGGWLGRSKSFDSGAGEPVSWLTASVAWLHHKCSQTPDFIDAWLRALTLEAERLQLEQQHQAGVVASSMPQLQIRFDGVHGPPPEFNGIKADTSSAEQLTLVASVSGREVILQLCCFLTSPHSALSSTPPPTSEVINCDARIQWIKGQVKLVVKLINNELSLSLSFLQPPDVRIQVHPIRANAQVDTQLIESLVRSALTSATTTISWTSSRSAQSHQQQQPSPLPFTRAQHYDTAAAASGGSALYPDLHNVQMRSQSFYRNREPTISAAQSSLTNQSTPSSQSPPSSPTYLTSQQQQQQQLGLTQQQLQPLQQQQMLQDKLDPTKSTHQRLLVKIIKANGLVDTEWGSCNAYCLVKLDHPGQSFMTNVIRNTVNPLWDEQFIFDIDGQSKTIQFEVLDRDKQPDNDLLGKASVLLEEIRRMPSSRQIIPLTGRPRSRTSTSGSVTVELIFMDSLAQLSMFNTQQQQIGTDLDGKSGQYYTGVGGLRDGTATLSAHDLALTAHQHPGSPRSTELQPKLIVTGSEPQANTVQMNQGMSGGYRTPADIKGRDKKEGFGATLRKKFALKKGSARAQSVDRFQSASLRETSYLKPPNNQTTDPHKQTVLDDTHVQYGGSGDPRRDRSNSFGSSIKKIFRRDKKTTSRDNSLQRPAPTGAASTVGLKGDLTLQYGGGTGGRFMREGTPVPPGRQDFDVQTDQRSKTGGLDVSYSASVPSVSPLREY